MGKKTNSYIKVLLLIYIFMSISSFGILAFANEQEELDYFVYKAYEALDEKNYDSAIDFCNKAIEISKEPFLYVLKSQIFNEKGNYDKAIEVLDETIKLWPEYSSAYIYKIIILVNLNKYNELINFLDDAISKTPNLTFLYKQKASVLATMEKIDEAIECCKLGVKNNPDSLTLYNDLTSYMFLGGKNTEEILGYLNKMIEINPYNEIALYNSSCIYSVNNNSDSSLKNLRTLVEISPKFKTYVMEDPDFENISHLESFKALTGVGIYVDGEFLEFDVAPVIEEGRVLIPLRAVFESLGASVEWVSSTKTVIGQLDGITLSLQIGSKKAIVNGTEYTLDVPGKIVNGRTLVPLRFVSESFGADVKWDGNTKTVYVTSKDEDTGNTDLSKDVIFDRLNSSLDLIYVDGMFPQPHDLGAKEGKITLVAKTEEDLNLFKSLNKKDKTDYLNTTVQENYGLVLGCETVEVSLVFNDKIYYRLYTGYDAHSDELELETFKRGLLSNIIKQDSDNLSYSYYYSN